MVTCKGPSTVGGSPEQTPMPFALRGLDCCKLRPTSPIGGPAMQKSLKVSHSKGVGFRLVLCLKT